MHTRGSLALQFPHRRIAVALAALFCCRETLAAPQNDLFELSLQELAQVRITTATLTEKSLESVPASVTVYNRDQIRRLGVRRLEDLLNFVPGYQSYNGDNSGFVHTFSSRGRRVGTSAREVLVLLDGHRLNNNWSGSMIASTLTPALENVERVEIIRGAGSAIYGSNAELGVINIITRTHTELSLESGGAERNQISAALYQGTEKSSFQLFSRQERDSGQALHVFDPNTKATVATRDPFLEQELYLRGKHGDFDIASRWSTAEGKDKYSFGYVSVPEEAAREEVTNYYVDGGWHHQFNSGLQVTARSFFGDSRYAPDVPIRSFFFTEATFREREQGFNLQLQQNDNANGRWVAGAEVRHPEVYEAIGYRTNTQAQTVQKIEEIDERSRTIAGLFGQYEYTLTASDNLIVGLRQDHYPDWGNHLSPRLGWIHQLDNANTLKLLYSEAFRAPSAVETEAASTVIVANPNLDPETAKTGELVWQRNTGSALWSSTLYSTGISSAITEVPLPSGGRGFANTHQSISGLEVECLLNFRDDWTLRTALTHQFDQASDINSESSNLISGSLSYSQRRWVATLGAYYAGPRRDTNDSDFDASTVEYNQLGGHSVAMANLSWTAQPQLELYLHADNLFDKQFFNPTNRFQNTEGAPARGRELVLGMRWKLDK